MSQPKQHSPELFDDVCGIIEGTRMRIATTVNAEVCMMNWMVGKRIKEDVLYNERAEYGKEIVKNLAVKLTERYGKGWGDTKNSNIVYAARTFFLKKRLGTQCVPNLHGRI